MQPRRPDRALRTIVVQLASLRQDDVEAILDALDTGERRQVEMLLAEYAGKGEAFPGGNSVRARLEATGLSPWLADRLERADEYCSGAMTPAAIAALQDCARDLFAPVGDATSSPNDRPSLLARIGSLFSRQRHMA